MEKLSIPFKLRLTLILLIGAGFLKPQAWQQLAIFASFACIWAIFLRVPLKKLSQLLGAELIFLSLIALPLGWERASFLLTRSLVCLFTINSFVLTLPPHSLAIALQSLPLPALLKQTLLLAAQYLEILLAEVQQMQTAAQCRGLTGTAGWLRHASASMIGALYLRSLQRAEQVYHAMLLRGYQGIISQDRQLTLQESSILIGLTVLVMMLSLSSYINTSI